MISRHALLGELFLLCGVLIACGQTTIENRELSPTGEATLIAVRILNLDIVNQATPVALPTPLPTATSTMPIPSPSLIEIDEQSATPTLGDQPPTCQNKAEFVRHITIADNTALKPGQQVTKIWQIRNIGSCIWTRDYSLVFFAGEIFGAATEIPFPQVVNPGETLDLRISIIAPLLPGVYTGNWFLQDAQGNRFGVGTDGTQALTVTVIVNQPPRRTRNPDIRDDSGYG